MFIFHWWITSPASYHQIFCHPNSNARLFFVHSGYCGNTQPHVSVLTAEHTTAYVDKNRILLWQKKQKDPLSVFDHILIKKTHKLPHSELVKCDCICRVTWPRTTRLIWLHSAAQWNFWYLLICSFKDLCNQKSLGSVKLDKTYISAVTLFLFRFLEKV